MDQILEFDHETLTSSLAHFQQVDDSELNENIYAPNTSQNNSNISSSSQRRRGNNQVPRKPLLNSYSSKINAQELDESSYEDHIGGGGASDLLRVINTAEEKEKIGKRYMKEQIYGDCKCAVCLHQFVKPITLICGHTFCQLCIMKYFLNNSKTCPLCRKHQPLSIDDFSINRVMDELSRKISPEKYMKILALNISEERRKKIKERLIKKYSDKNRVPTAYERFVWLINFLVPYFKTMKVIMTIFTPILILIWYAKNFSRVANKGGRSRHFIFKDLENDSVFYLSNAINFNYYETLLLRFSQLIFSLVGLL